MNQNIGLWFLGVHLAFSLCWGGDPIRLIFEDGTYVGNYEALAGQISPGTFVLLGKHRVQFGELLSAPGTGDVDHIYAIGDGKVIRIRKYRGNGKPSQIRLGYAMLKEHNVTMPHYYREESVEGAFDILERVPVVFRLSDVFAGRVVLDPATRHQIWQELAEFAKTTSDFSRIGDFKSKNIVWTGSKWLLIDWDSGHVESYRSETRNAFFVGELHAGLPPTVLNNINRAIQWKRTHVPIGCVGELGQLSSPHAVSH